MSAPKIRLSVITLSYNQSSFIHQNIDSVKDHLTSGVEHIIIDPGSKDGSREIIEFYFSQYPNVIKVFESDTGPAQGLNKGLKLARGEWISILNADDFFATESLLKFLSTVKELSKYDIVYGHGYLLEENIIKKIHVGRLKMRNFALNQQQIFQPSVFFRRQKIKDSKVIFNEKNNTCWDAEFIFELMKYGNAKLKRIPVYFSVFRLHPGSISGSQNNPCQYRGDILEISRKARSGRSRKWDLFVSYVEQSVVLFWPKRFVLKIIYMTYFLKFKKN